MCMLSKASAEAEAFRRERNNLKDWINDKQMCPNNCTTDTMTIGELSTTDTITVGESSITDTITVGESSTTDTITVGTTNIMTVGESTTATTTARKKRTFSEVTKDDAPANTASPEVIVSEKS